MKALFSILLIVSYAHGFCQWNLIHTDSNLTEVYDIHFFSKDKGLIGGFGGPSPLFCCGFILRTTDGGEAWSHSDSIHYFITSISFINDSVGFSGGQDGVVLKTRDRGITWEVIKSDYGAFHDIDAIHFFNDSTGIVKTYGGEIFRTSNSGADWEHITTLQYRFYFIYGSTHPFQFLSDSIGFVAANGIYKTVDQGLTWQKLNVDTLPYFRAIHMFDELEGFAVGNAGILIHTKDGGMTWETDSITDQDLRDIAFIDDSIGICVGGGFMQFVDTIGILLTTYDRGITWTQHKISNTRLNAIQVIDSVGYIAGRYGEVFKLDNFKTLSIQRLNLKKRMLNIWPNPTSSHFNFKAPENFPIEEIKIFNVKGQTMLQMKSPIEMPVSVVDFPSGLYFVQVKSKGKTLYNKLIKE